jgi:hypothetical protein
VPTWHDAVDLLITPNMSSRKGGGRRGGGGGGGGRSRGKRRD